MKLTLPDLLFWFVIFALWVIAWIALRRWRADVVYAGYLGLFTTAFFWRVLFSGAFIPEGGGDMAAILYPVYHYAQETLRSGVIPLWNPHLYAGIPFVGHIQSGPFYPPNLLLFFLTQEVTYRSLEYLLIAHFWLAGLLMYTLLRGITLHTVQAQPASGGTGSAADAGPSETISRPARGELGLSRPAALLGAVVFMFNDFNITHIGNPNMVAVGAWLPLALLCFHRALVNRRAFGAALAGAVTGMAYLAGHIQPFLYILFAIGLYAGYEALMDSAALRRAQAGLGPFMRGTIPPWVRPLAYLAVFLAFTVAVAGVSLIPNLEMSSQSLRDSLSYADAARFSLSPAEMIGMFVPALFGRGPSIHWGPWERVEVGYIGILPLILAALGLIWHRERTPRFFALLGMVSLVLALGLHSIVHGWLFLVPGYAQIRVPARFVFLLDFAFAALAAYGFDALLRPLALHRRAAWRAVFPVLAVALAGVLFVFAPLMFVAVTLTQSQDASIFNRVANGFNGVMLFALLLGTSLVLLCARRSRWLRPPIWALSVLCFVFLDLASLGAYIDIGETDPSANFQHPQAIEFLKNDPNLFRIETPEDSWFQWQPNLGLIARLDDAAGIYNPLLLQRYDRYWKAAATRDNVLYDLLNSKYLVTRKDAKVGARFSPVFDGDPQVNIWLNSKALPRTFMVYGSKIVEGGDAAFAAITQQDFDPTALIVLESTSAGAQTSSSAPGASVPSGVGVLEHAVNSSTYQVDTASEGYLFVGDTFYPGWRATVDGQDAPLLRADYLFRAVKVPPGKHTVRMFFDPVSWKIGVALTFSGLVLLTCWWVLGNRRSRTVSSMVLP
jgi:hypothetical protein